MHHLKHFFIVGLVALCIPLASAQSVVQGKGSTFHVTFDPLYNSTMQSIMLDAVTFWADSVRSPVPIELDIAAVKLTCSYSYNTHVDTQPAPAVMNFPNAPLANTYYPIALANALAGIDLQPNSPDITIRFNSKMITNSVCARWYLGYDANYTFYEYSLYFETLQEIAHGLGLHTLGNLMTGERYNGYNDIYWLHLKSEKSDKMLSDMTATQVADVAHDSMNLAFKGEKSWLAAEQIANSRTSDAILLFSRSYNAPALTGQHVHESSRPLQIMNLDLRGAVPETELAVAMLEDLGWQSTRNSVPVIEDQQTLSIPEDSQWTLSLADLIITDETPDELTLSVAAGSHYQVAGTTVIPDVNFFGTLSIPVTVSDAEYTSEPFTVALTVTSVNDLPVITGQRPLSTPEDTRLTLTAANFIITDLDSSNFSLVIGDGEHYSVDGDSITPAADFVGTLSVPVQVNDGFDNSAVFTASITVTAVNDAPVIVSQQSLAINEDNSLTLDRNMLTIRDVDSSQFTLAAANGSNYSVSGLTITPAANFNGVLTVPVTVSDGQATSSSFALQIQVNAVNDAPAVTAQRNLSLAEDSSLVLSVNDFTITDVDSSVFSLTVLAGDHYDFIGSKIIPAANYFGPLAIKVTVNDGAASSAIFVAQATVTAVNDAPEIIGQVLVNIEEEAPFTLSPVLLTIRDVDDTEFTLQASTGANYSLTGNTLTPDDNFNGTLNVAVTVSDGDLTSNTYVLDIQVLPKNDPPVVTGQTTLRIDEDSSLPLTPALLEFSDVDSDEFVLVAQAGAHYQIINNELVPDANFFGTLTVPMQISDTIELSNVFNALVTVTAVNDAPVVNAQQNLSVPEDTSLTLSTDVFTITDVDSNEFSLIVSGGNHYSVSGNTVTPDQDFNGTLTVPVQVNDGSANSDLFYAQVSVLAVNDAPVITAQQSLSIDEDSTLTMSTELLNISDPDSTSFTLQALPGEHYQISGTQLVPTANFFGTLSIPVQVSDGDAVSNTWTLQVAVNSINDAPVIAELTPQQILEDSSLFVSAEILTVVDPDDETFTLNIARGEHYQVAGNEIIPAANWFGDLAIDVTVNDGETDSNTETLYINVMEVNDLPEITTNALPTGQIYRAWQARLSARDIDGDALSFGKIKGPDWLTINADGSLNAFPTELMIGEHPVEVSVNDGRATTAVELILTVLDDETATDTALEFSIDRTIWSTNGWVPVTLNLANNGPKDSVASTVTIQFAGEWSSQDNRCQVNQNRCAVELTAAESIAIAVRQSTPGSTDLTASIVHDGFETDETNNQAMLTLTFSDGLPTSPQYSVPSFGQGTVRAIGLANVQGGRWPEIMFANGPLEASTVYKFEKSLFRPDLHSHLADASDSYAMALFDIDNDGDIDWVLANGNGEANTVYRNKGDGFFELIDVLGNYDSRAVAFGDVDRDGDLDLVFANNNDPNTLYLNNGDGTFSFHSEFPSRHSRAVIIHDFDGDGRPDIVFANRGWRNRIYFNRGFGHGPVARTLLSSRSFAVTGEESNQSTEDTLVTEELVSGFSGIEFGNADDLTSKATLADLDGDGIASDLVMVNESSERTPASIQLFAFDTQGNNVLTGETKTGSVADLSVGDYDGDGKDDVAVLRPGGALEVMSASAGQLTTIEVMDTDGADTILMVDVDGSGQADVISANNRSDSSRLDFAGEVVNNEASEDNDGSPAVVLPERPTVASVKPTTSASQSKGGAGLPLLLLPMLLLFKRR